MKYSLIFFCFLLFFSCRNKEEKNVAKPVITEVSTDSVPDFFPVTTYIKGEIYNIKSIGISPVRKITIGTHTDSSFVKAEDYEKVFADFLSPVIDSINLKKSFKETKFLDQTLNAFTFSYDPVTPAADSFAFSHWDVYIDAETNAVRRVYMVKKAGADRQLQLTWQSGKWCKTVTLNTAEKGGVEKEEKISWTYNE